MPLSAPKMPRWMKKLLARSVPRSPALTQTESLRRPCAWRLHYLTLEAKPTRWVPAVWLGPCPRRRLRQRHLRQIADTPVSPEASPPCSSQDPSLSQPTRVCDLAKAVSPSMAKSSALPSRVRSPARLEGELEMFSRFPGFSANWNFFH